MVLVPEEFVNDFTEDQKQLILDLSRDVVIGFGTSVTEDCPNCIYDGVTGSSGAVYTNFSGEITLFSGTTYEQTYTAQNFKQTCPICKNKGYLSFPNEKTIKAHVKWKNRYSETYPTSPAGYEGQNTVRIKTDSDYYDDFLKAKYFIADGVKVEPFSTPFIRAMKSMDGIVEVWCRTIETGKEIKK